MKVLIFGSALVDYESDTVVEPIILDLEPGWDTLWDRWAEIIKEEYGVRYFDHFVIDYVMTPDGTLYMHDLDHYKKFKPKYYGG